jgi:hypothetical protein
MFSHDLEHSGAESRAGEVNIFAALDMYVASCNQLHHREILDNTFLQFNPRKLVMSVQDNPEKIQISSTAKNYSDKSVVHLS